jgi:hypothetical protein
MVGGVETRSDALGFELTKQCFRHGVLAIFAFNRQSTLQVMPPLAISAEEVDEALERLGGAVAAMGCLSDVGPALLRPRSVRRRACGAIMSRSMGLARYRHPADSPLSRQPTTRSVRVPESRARRPSRRSDPTRDRPRKDRDRLPARSGCVQRT